MAETSSDTATAAAFAESWNRLAAGSAYTRAQFLDWFAPLGPEDFRGEAVLELGFGNGSLLVHAASFHPKRLVGIELGDTLETAKRNLAGFDDVDVRLHRGDLASAELGRFDFVYCIGVLHHLTSPSAGFASVLRHTRPGGRFHCWVYADEGNALVRNIVDPIRRLSSRLPWWLTRYAVALPLVLPYFVYAKLLRTVWPQGAPAWLRPVLPLHDYSLWIAERGFRFFHHVAFDQLLAPTSHYIRREQVDEWLSDPLVEAGSTYVVFRNGNSWKFGGKRVRE